MSEPTTPAPPTGAGEKIAGLVWSELRRYIRAENPSMAATAQADSDASAAADNLIERLAVNGYAIVPATAVPDAAAVESMYRLALFADDRDVDDFHTEDVKRVLAYVQANPIHEEQYAWLAQEGTGDGERCVVCGAPATAETPDRWHDGYHEPNHGTVPVCSRHLTAGDAGGAEGGE